jgi:hypothetical protein
VASVASRELKLSVTGTNPLEGQDSFSFLPTDSLSVFTTISMKGKSSFSGLVHEFRAVGPNDGNLNGDEVVDVRDLDFLAERMRDRAPDPRFDLNRSGHVSSNDYRYWVNKLAGTYIGDANLDGEFNSADLVQVLASDEYRDTKQRNSTWSTGDFDGDREFDQQDIRYAWQESGDVFERGSRVSAIPVPESVMGGVQMTVLWVILSGFPLPFRPCRFRVRRHQGLAFRIDR